MSKQYVQLVSMLRIRYFVTSWTYCLDIAVCTGAGTGLDAPAVQRKTEVLREVLALHAGATAPLDALAAFGGFEIATMVGAVLPGGP